MGKKNKRRELEKSTAKPPASETRPAKPSYLGLLNAIAVGEAQADELLCAWRDATQNESLAAVLNFVAIREREHAAAFEKRICELGFSVRSSAAERFQQRLALAGSDASDRDKFAELLNLRSSDDGDDDPFGALFDDKSIDPTTGALLGRYIAEERDSGRRLRAACAALDNPASDPVLDDIAERLDRLTSTLEELKALRG